MESRTSAQLKKFVEDLLQHSTFSDSHIDKLSSEWNSIIDRVNAKMQADAAKEQWSECLTTIDNLFLQLSRLIADVKRNGLGEEVYSKSLFDFYCGMRSDIQNKMGI